MNRYFPALQRLALLIVCLLGYPSSFGQAPLPPGLPPRPPQTPGASGSDNKVEPIFDLDFPGGTLSEFIEAVGKARGNPVNVVAKDEDKDTPIQSLKMHQVNVPTLFTALSSASPKSYRISENDRLGNKISSIYTYQFAFTHFSSGDSTVWYFSKTAPPIEDSQGGSTPPAVVRFYNIEPYLEKYTIEDITTALNTGYQLLSGSTDRLNLKYHKETKLLIVRGVPAELMLIDDALRQLRPTETPKGNIPGGTGSKPKPPGNF